LILAVAFAVGDAWLRFNMLCTQDVVHRTQVNVEMLLSLRVKYCGNFFMIDGILKRFFFFYVFDRLTRNVLANEKSAKGMNPRVVNP